MVEVQSKDTEDFLIASKKGIIGKLYGEPQNQTEQCPSKELQLIPQCPDCGSYNINRNGFRRIKDQAETQVFKCKECGLRFSEKYYMHRGQHGFANYALCKEAKKLDTATENTTVAGDEKNIKGNLLEFHVKMKLRGYKDATIRLNKSALNTLINKGADLTDSESVKK